MHLRQLEGVSFVNRRYTKGVPFLSKMVCKRIRGGGGGKVGGPSSYNTLLSAPLAHYVLQREAVCSFAACYCHIVSFLLFIVFNWNASIFLASKSSVHPFGRLFTVHYFFVRSFRYTASYRHGYISIFKCTEGAGVGDNSSGGGGGTRKIPPPPPK